MWGIDDMPCILSPETSFLFSPSEYEPANNVGEEHKQVYEVKVTEQQDDRDMPPRANALTFKFSGGTAAASSSSVSVESASEVVDNLADRHVEIMSHPNYRNVNMENARLLLKNGTLDYVIWWSDYNTNYYISHLSPSTFYCHYLGVKSDGFISQGPDSTKHPDLDSFIASIFELGQAKLKTSSHI